MAATFKPNEKAYVKPGYGAWKEVEGCIVTYYCCGIDGRHTVRIGEQYFASAVPYLALEPLKLALVPKCALKKKTGAMAIAGKFIYNLITAEDIPFEMVK